MEAKKDTTEVIEATITEEESVVLKPIKYDEANKILEEVKANVGTRYLPLDKYVGDVDLKELDNDVLKADYKIAKEAHIKVSKIRTTTEKIRKELKAPALAYGKEVDSRAKDIVKQFEPLEVKYKGIREKFEKEIERRSAIIEANYIKLKTKLQSISFKTSQEAQEFLDREIKLEPKEYGNYIQELQELIVMAKNRAKEMKPLLEAKEVQAKEAEAQSNLTKLTTLTVFEATKQDVARVESTLSSLRNAYYGALTETASILFKTIEDKIKEAKAKIAEQERKERLEHIRAKALDMLTNSRFVELDAFAKELGEGSKEFNYIKDVLFEAKQRYEKAKQEEAKTVKRRDIAIEKKAQPEAKVNVSRESGLFGAKKSETIVTNTIKPKEQKEPSKSLLDEFIDVDDYISKLEDREVCVDIKYLAMLIKESKVLKALERGGVDNWEWYSESYPMDDELLEDVAKEIKECING